ncbi:PIG-L family deacetylase [Dietzia sp. SLG510A3-30A2]|nr:PIG-L family deacetylase [Dietzia sp. SLG510A3-30A2]
MENDGIDHRVRTVLALGAHTDDVEIGAGGTLSRLRGEGWRIVAVAASRAEASLPPDLPADTLEREFRDSMSILGAAQVEVLGYPVRRLNEHRQDLLEDYVRIRRSVQPDLVLTHSSNDVHQDHSVVHQESIRAFKSASILGYHAPWNERVTNSEVFVALSENDLQVKAQLIACYRSQALLGRSYVTDGFADVAARFAGFQSQTKYAEAFEAISIVRGQDADCW